MNLRRVVSAVLCCCLWASVTSAAVTQPTPEQLRSASLEGKYTDLLHVLLVPEDRSYYGEFNEWGYWTGDQWGDYTNLKSGFWVYVHPNWYVWEHQSK